MGLEKIPLKNSAIPDGHAMSRAVIDDSSESDVENNMATDVNNFLRRR